MKSLMIFAGAGASRGVSAEKYPMALDFRKRLPESVTKAPLYNLLQNRLGETTSSDGIDIEHVLWELGKLSDATGAWADRESFANYLLTTGLIDQVVALRGQSPALAAQLAQLKAVISSLQDQINERVYEFYSREPSKEELDSSWFPLLESVPRHGFSRTDLVTTNYDLIIEAALMSAANEDIDMGHTGGLTPGIALDGWRRSDSSIGRLTKLHGSVDWKLGNGGTGDDPTIRRGHPEFDGNHDKRLILYPGFKGEPQREPFVTFHKYLERRLKDVTHLLFIGFAFRDEFINRLLNNAYAGQAFKVAVLDPTFELPQHQFLSKAVHIKKPFGKAPTMGLLSSSSCFSLDELGEWTK